MATSGTNNQGDGKVPFWKPWGIGGFLWRTLLFLASIVMLCFLFSNLSTCDRSDNKGGGGGDVNNGNDSTWNGGFFRPDRPAPPGWDTIRYVPDTTSQPYRELPPEVRNNDPVERWKDTIRIPELPNPDDNRIPPVNPYDSTRVVPNPVDSLSKIVADELIVFFNSKDIKTDIESFAKQFKSLYPSSAYKVKYYNTGAGTMILGVPNDKLLQVMEDLPKQITGIDFVVTVNEIVEETYIPADPDFKTVSYDTYFKLIQAYDAWDVTKGSAEVKVAIVDSYFDLTNPEIGERYVDPVFIPTNTKNVLPPTTPPSGPGALAAYCHGSHVAGIAIGGQNNSLGCSGIAPECTWIPVALGDQMTAFNVIEGIMYAIYHDADVVNVSLGRKFTPYSNSDPDAIHLPLEDQIEYYEEVSKRGEVLWQYIYKVANDHKCVICSASGNDDFLTGMDPMKRCENIVRVEAVDGAGIKADFSNYGIVAEKDMNFSTVAAPGVNLWSATPKSCVPYWKAIEEQTHFKSSCDGFQEMSGTSMAAPVVTGAVALLKSKNKDLTTEEIINILRMTSKQTDTINPIGPTLQIRDALDATGGEKANFDELVKDHSMIIGKWKSTYSINIVNLATGEKLDEAWCYMIFSSETSGTIEWHRIGEKKVYTAPLSVDWDKNDIKIMQHGNSQAPDGDELLKSECFLCKPDKTRLLRAEALTDGKEEYNFELEKVY